MDSLQDKKQTVFRLQLVLVVMISFFMLLSPSYAKQEVRVYALIALFLGSALAIQRLPVRFLEKSFFWIGLLFVDTLLIYLGVALNLKAQWELLIFYFFILFLAAIGASLAKAILGFIVVSCVYVAFLYQQKGVFINITELLVRLHFLLGVTLLYGYVAEDAQKEKRRAELAEQRERLKMSLVSAIAHDIKTPLGVILSSMENMKSSLSQTAVGRYYEGLVETVSNSAEKIIHLVTRFMEASRVALIKAEPATKAIDLNDLVRGVFRHQKIELDKKDLTVSLALEANPAIIQGDEMGLERVFWNLINNAIKFTPKRGRLNVRSWDDKDGVYISISDTGLGIAAEDLPLLFSQFRRFKGSENTEGTGLGLFIVKTIIDEHGGRVDVQSQFGKGSTFTVFFPRGRPLV